jgi:putative ABC transport system permease protein
VPQGVSIVTDERRDLREGRAARAAAPEPSDVNLALKDIRHNLGRFLLTCVGLSLLLGIVLAMIGIYRGLVLESLGLARAAGADVWVVEGGTRGPFAEASRLPGDCAMPSRRNGASPPRARCLSERRGAASRRDQAPLVVGAEIGRPGEAPADRRGPADLRSRTRMVADRSSGAALGEIVKLGRDTSRSSA